MYLLLGQSTVLYLQWVFGGLSALVRQSSTHRSLPCLQHGVDFEPRDTNEGRNYDASSTHSFCGPVDQHVM
jgi:hypothetical protein